MPIEVKCPSCERGLRVPDKVAGKRIKCPKCSGIVNVPSANTPEKSWEVQTEEGEKYGPISRVELDEWHKEGRITSETQLLAEGSDQWQWASDVYPELDPEARPVAPAANDPFNFGDAAPSAPTSDNPFDFGGAKSPDGGTTTAANTQGNALATTPAATVSSNASAKPIKRSTAGLLSIYLGAFGVGRFYMGYKGLGITQLLITVLSCGTLSIVSAIWGHIDGIKIITKSMNEDGFGHPLVD